jgi:aminobenzoyl-glutamate utilization protein B
MRLPKQLTRLASLLLIGTGLGAPPALADLAQSDRQMLLANADTYQPRLRATALAIWNFAEPGFHEDRSSARLQDELRRAGFNVESGVAGMPTAFVAKYRTGDGPVIGLLAEFDALPGLSQQAVPTRQAIAGADYGHACGHNLFGAASVDAAIAARKWMIATGVKGEIRVYGSPAEEGGSGKVFLIRAGLANDVDAMLHWHPADHDSASQGGTLASISGKFRFTGIAAHAAMAPERGRSALDGVQAMNMMVEMLREHVPQETRMHYVITDGGKAPNVVPEKAESYYYIRNPSQAVLRGIFERVMNAAKAGALGTGTQVSFVQTGGSFDVLPNDTLGRILYRNLTSLPATTHSAADMAFMTAVEKTLPAGAANTADGIEPYSFGGVNYVSSDVGDVSYVTPTAGITTQTWAPGTPAHSWQAVAASGNEVGIEGADRAARALALSIADLMRNPAALKEAKAELDRRRGADFIYSSLMGDKPPALDYRKTGE